MPYHSLPCVWPPLKRPLKQPYGRFMVGHQKIGRPSLKHPYGCFRGGHLQGSWPVAVLITARIPHAIRVCFLTVFAIFGHKQAGVVVHRVTVWGRRGEGHFGGVVGKQYTIIWHIRALVYKMRPSECRSHG
jgi:hypothetical protein